MTGGSTWLIISIVLLLCLSGFLSASETALTAVSRARISRKARQGDRRARLVETLLNRREHLIGAILVGNNLTNILASILATSVLLVNFGVVGMVYATVIMTVLVVVFSEIMPKTFALSRSESISLRVAPVINLLTFIFSPFTATVQTATLFLMKIVTSAATKEDQKREAREEVEGVIELHHDAGHMVKQDRDMLGGVLDLGEVNVGEIMIHHKNMAIVNADLPPQKLIEEILACGHTRVPLWRAEKDNIIGFLHIRDLLHTLAQTKGDYSRLSLDKLIHPAWFVPETTLLHNQLREFLRRKVHFAFVVDEYGALTGMVTLKDILEEIVGDIADEHDKGAVDFKPSKDGSLILPGHTPIRDVNRAMDWTLPDDEVSTIAGLLIHEVQTIPREGEVFSCHGFDFEILSRQGNRVRRLRIKPQKKSDPASDPAHVDPEQRPASRAR